MERKIALYMRLSKEDEFCHVESNSISMQRILLNNHAGEIFPGSSVVEFIDDGYSGTNFERPGIQELLSAVKDGMIGCIIVKDFSRFCRDYIELGSYLEQIFPFMGVRFISINDGYDSDSYRGSVADLDINFKNLLYDMYSKDMSVNIRSTFRTSMEKGKFLGTNAPFGYVKNPENRHQLIIKEDQAAVVRRIFDMREAGMSMTEICRILNAEKVKTPAEFMVEMGVMQYVSKRGGYYWSVAIVSRILRNRVYCGDLVQGKMHSDGIRGKKVRSDEKDVVVVKDCHEPIVTRRQFEAVQTGKKMQKKKPFGQSHVLVGFLACGGCERRLTFASEGRGRFRCSGRGINGVEKCIRGISAEGISDRVLSEIKGRVIEKGLYEEILVKEKEKAEERLTALIGKKAEVRKEIATHKKKRIEEYEAYVEGRRGEFDRENVEGKRLEEMMTEVDARIRAAEDEVIKMRKRTGDKEYVADELTRELLEKFVERIVVYGEEDIDIIWKKF